MLQSDVQHDADGYADDDQLPPHDDTHALYARYRIWQYGQLEMTAFGLFSSTCSRLVGWAHNFAARFEG
jgi:hypothetical protein